MADRAVHFGTFDAEQAWRPPDLATLPAAPTGRGAGGMDQLLVAGCGRGDTLLTATAAPAAMADAATAAGLVPRRRVVPGPPGAPVEQRLAAVDPGWLPEVAGERAAVFAIRPDTAPALRRLRLAAAVPPPAVVAEVNSKVWSNALVQRRGLAGAAEVARSPEALRRLVERLGSQDAVVKDPYGVAGRGALRLSSPRMLQAVVRHLTAQVRRGRRVELLVQPLFAGELDFSSHLAIADTGEVQWLGLQRVENREFSFQGAGPAPAGLAQRLGDAHRRLLHEIAAELFAAGYTGPVCVDGMLLRDESVVPVLEINARRSMGWLNLQLDHRAHRCGLRAWLRCRTVEWPAEDHAEHLVARLHERAALFTGSRPGLLPLAAIPAGGPRRRLFCAAFAADDVGLAALDRSLTGALAQPAAGVRIAGRGGQPTQEARPT